ncbi:MAG: beta-ketoacyl-ACP synthase [Gemmatimonadetes bacterium]|nr:beta-ketoacyl-ACP synthase [Gemmatimonadota bacterium]
MRERVVVTGLGVVAPNGNNVTQFEQSLREGRSGIRKIDLLEELGFGCQVAGVPRGTDTIAEDLFTQEELMAMSSGMRFAGIAALEAWRDGGLDRPRPDDDAVDWECGAVIGTGIGGIDVVGERLVPFTDAARVRRLGSACVEQVMASSVSAKIGGMFGLGNRVTTNSSACTTGTEAIHVAAERIAGGGATRMLAGAVEGASHYIWAGFDGMRVLARGFNESPARASRPMSASATGFVPAAGAGVLLLERLESALERNASIHAEILGGHVNCGGQRQGGSMTAPNPVGVQLCIRGALRHAGIDAREVDAISGHLTATMADPLELRNWAEALSREPSELPPITATKSLIGHALGAAGAIESIAAILMVRERFLHASVNCDDLHARLDAYADSVVHRSRAINDLNVMLKAGFGFGDVNCCLVFKHWDS